MNATQDPVVAAAIRAELIRRVEETPRPRRNGTGAIRLGGRPRLVGLIATGATLVLVVVASAAAITLAGRSVGSPAGAGLPSEVVVDGKTIPAAGAVPWSDAVVDQADPRVLTFLASGGVVSPKTRFCFLDDWRAVAVETPTSVRILAEGYAVPIGPDVPCPASAPQPRELRYILKAPLAGRTLIDESSGRAQPVLDGSTVPMIGILPTAYEWTVGWDQESGIAVRTYVYRDRPSAGSISIEYGTPAALAHSGVVSRAPDRDDVTVEGASASLWRFESGGGAGEHTTRIEWTAADGDRYRLDVTQPTAGRQWTEEEVLLLARSVDTSPTHLAPLTPQPSGSTGQG